MGSENLFKRRQNERKKRRQDIKKQKSSTWLIVCEGEQTEPNYFIEAIDEINKSIDDGYKIKYKVEGKGMNTQSLVKSVDEIQNQIDGFSSSVTILYGKIFVVFDKDSFDNDAFDNAVKMCDDNGYIALWSNQAIEYWFLLHFNYIDVGMDRKEYSKKINLYFKKKGLDYKYHKNDAEIYSKLCKYGSLQKAIKNAKRVHSDHSKDTPAKSESCTTVYRFFDAIEEKLQELE